jgi:hypothetical protein
MKRLVTELLLMWTWQSVLTAAVIFLMSFCFSLGVVSFVLVKLPADYFSESSERKFLVKR